MASPGQHILIKGQKLLPFSPANKSGIFNHHMISFEVFQKGSVTILDQSLVSFTNFFTSFILARYLVPDQYGIFVVLFSIYVFFNSIQSALITGPMAALGAPLNLIDATRYYSSLTILHFGLLFSLVPMLFGVGLTLPYFIVRSGIFSVFYAASFGMLANMFQDYFRKVLFTRLEAKGAFRNDIISYILKILGVICLAKLGRLSISATFVVLGMTSFVAGLYGIYQCRAILNFESVKLRKALKENWNFGKWLLAGVFTQQGSNQIFIYISAIFLSSSLVGALGAGRNILGVTHIFLVGMDNIVNPMASKKYISNGSDGLYGFLRRVTALGGFFIIGYCLLVSIFPSQLMDLLYRGQYAEYWPVVILFSVQHLFIFTSRIPAYGVKAMRKPELIFFSNLIATGSSLIVAVPLIMYLGVYGACSGMILTQIILSTALYLKYRSYYRAGSAQ